MHRAAAEPGTWTPRLGMPLLRAAWALLGLGLLAACAGGGAGATGTGPGGTAPSFTLSLGQTAGTAASGQDLAVSLQVQPQGGFSAPVSLAALNLPAGVSASFSPSSLQPPGSAASTCTFHVASGTSAVPAQTVQIQASGSGITQLASFQLAVTAATKGFSLGLAPAALTIPKGSAAATGITVTPLNGFTGAVTLSTSSLPTGVTAAFAPNPTTGSSSLTLTAGTSALAETTTITITGASAGAPSASATLSLTVTQPAAGNQVSVTPCFQENDVLFVAYRDGAGAWTAAAGSGGTYTFPLASGRGAVAITLRNQTAPDQIYTMVLLGSTAELAAWLPGPCPGYQSVSGTYSGAASGHLVSVSLGISGVTGVVVPTGATAGPWTTRAVQRKATGDLFASEAIVGGATVKCILRRDIPLAAANPALGGDLNFAGSEAFPPQTYSVTTSGLIGTAYAVNASSHLWNAGLDIGLVGSCAALNGASLPPLALVPAARLRAGDLQSVMATAMPIPYASNGTTPMLLASLWSATPQNASLDFRAPAVPPTVALLQSQPHPRLRFTSSLAAPYPSALLLSATQVQGSTSSRGWQIILSPGYLGAGGAFPVDTPDLSAAAGWNASWDLWPAVKLSWTTNHQAASWTSGSAVDGGRQWSCSYTASITP